jgi:hypothetical protein
VDVKVNDKTGEVWALRDAGSGHLRGSATITEGDEITAVFLDFTNTVKVNHRFGQQRVEDHRRGGPPDCATKANSRLTWNLTAPTASACAPGCISALHRRTPTAKNGCIQQNRRTQQMIEAAAGFRQAPQRLQLSISNQCCFKTRHRPQLPLRTETGIIARVCTERLGVQTTIVNGVRRSDRRAHHPVSALTFSGGGLRGSGGLTRLASSVRRTFQITLPYEWQNGAVSIRGGPGRAREEQNEPCLLCDPDLTFVQQRYG